MPTPVGGLGTVDLVVTRNKLNHNSVEANIGTSWPILIEACPVKHWTKPLYMVYSPIGGENMSRKTTKYTRSGIQSLSDDKPALYRIETAGGRTNYIGIAKRGRVRERITEHLGEIRGVKVSIEQFLSIDEARRKESRVTSRKNPKYNKRG